MRTRDMDASERRVILGTHFTIVRHRERHTSVITKQGRPQRSHRKELLNSVKEEGLSILRQKKTISIRPMHLSPNGRGDSACDRYYANGAWIVLLVLGYIINRVIAWIPLPGTLF